MHKNEPKVTGENFVKYMAEAEALSPRHVEALKEQFKRQEEENK